jgi:isohexenylglutaconyl-CoA hydratase
MSPYQTLLVQAQGAVLQVRLNRPQVRNAMNLLMVSELRQVLREAEVSGDVRVLVLRGEGGHFCAGGDISDMKQADQPAPEIAGPVVDPLAAVSTAFGELCVAFSGTGLATVAVLQGAVMGGGFGLACVVDLVLADSSATFRLPETSLGLVPAQIAPFLVERLGFNQAKRLAVTGGKLDAAQATALGLVHVLIDASSIDAAVQRHCSQILLGAPQAIAATKRLLSQARWVAPADLVAEAASVFSQAARGVEGREGTAAFVQKRKPRWAPP